MNKTTTKQFLVAATAGITAAIVAPMVAPIVHAWIQKIITGK